LSKWFFRKEGQSLVEVVVALSVFMIAFVAVVTLATNVVRYMLSSRQKIEATTIAQGEMERIKAKPGNSCAGSLLPGSSDSTTYSGYTIFYSSEDPSSPFPASDYDLVTIKVEWVDRGITDSLELKQVVRSQW